MAAIIEELPTHCQSSVPWRSRISRILWVFEVRIFAYLLCKFCELRSEIPVLRLNTEQATKVSFRARRSARTKLRLPKPNGKIPPLWSGHAVVLKGGEKLMDTEIVRLHREGKRAESLRRFADEYQARILALARRLLGNHEDALDALQETLIQVDRSLPKFKGDSSLYTWAFRLATNCCLNYKRRLGRATSYAPLDEALRDAVLLPVARPDDNPDTRCRARFRQHLVEQALLKLPETQRAVLVLCDLEDMTASETAEVLQISVNVVKSRLHRGRAKLKRIVEKDFEALGVELDGVHTFECTWQYLSETANAA
jgi:RNA polymerase sigma-70 factor (ECF subfamily)